jgi:hypothetical protein
MLNFVKFMVTKMVRKLIFVVVGTGSGLKKNQDHGSRIQVKHS